MFTVEFAGTALAYGLLVLLFAIGYLAGRLR